MGADPAEHAGASTAEPASVAPAAAAAPQAEEPSGAPSSTLEPARKRQKRLCHDFMTNGSCRFGDKCTFAHSKAEAATSSTLEPPAQKKKRQKQPKTRGSLKHMCHDFVKKGSCRYGDKCTFAHSQAELKPSMRSPEIPAARKLLLQRVAERQAAAAGRARGQRSMQDLPSFVTRYCHEMFWVSPAEPVCCPLFQNDRATAEYGAIAVADSERKTCTAEDQYVHMHKNELCIVGVARTHSMFAEGREVRSISYKQDCDKISGKKKKGATKLEQGSVLAVVICDDGSEWPVKAAVPGALIEINTRLVADPSLLQVR